MEFKDVINKRRSVRDFQDARVPETIIMNAIENAFKAPTYNHLREWNFIIVRSLESKLKLIKSEQLEKAIDIKELEFIFRNDDSIMREMYLDAIPKQKQMILEAPVVVAVVYKPKTRVEEAKKIYDLNCLASVWACIENFLLSLVEYNVYGVTFVPQNIDNIKLELGIPPELEVAAIIPIGYKAPKAKTLRQKEVNIQERIHQEVW